MPVPCNKCGNLVELHATRESLLTKKLMCDECCSVENQVNDLVEEAKDIQYDLDNHAEHMKGDRRGWKKNLKNLKQQIDDLGFNSENLLS